MELEKAIQACKHNDRSAQKQIYYALAPTLMTVCRRYAKKNIVSPEDVLQEAFIQIFKSVTTFDPAKGSFEKWSRTITAFTALKLNKKYSHNHAILHNNIDANAKIVSAIDKLTEDELLLLVSDLPDGFREVFNLYVIEGFSHKEIGKLLDIKEASSRSQLSRARAILQKKINALKVKLKVI